MKYVLIFLGMCSLVLGILGIFLPILPTTPFLLLSAALFARSSRRLYDRLLGHKALGGYIRGFMEERALPLRIKIVSLSMMWCAMLGCIFFVAEGVLWLQIVLAGVGVGVSVHILSYKTKK
ncbi:MAG: YbaN family protein [Tannerella sp.]|jgi:uncharacterized membrane protein YbaN (DUF454 family)|nr:YbaN family protein [Tannerella sp.]